MCWVDDWCCRNQTPLSLALDTGNSTLCNIAWFECMWLAGGGKHDPVHQIPLWCFFSNFMNIPSSRAYGLRTVSFLCWSFVSWHYVGTSARDAIRALTNKGVRLLLICVWWLCLCVCVYGLWTKAFISSHFYLMNVFVFVTWVVHR